ncbi:hypothetical protein BWI93_23385 [Siphonobacter sp. BAB-5385]|uniref:TlpA family protein disulfide reductase n=1 Tax=Siphonobacter sp. BAB-5385 TaxID=1864822 RepID=UPI000B9E3C55|nr:TlpA disulfide reductase family protein [Siphonobacter sp. BAB-5385]OZI05843.1 hypothetical protein BWI93_23385 [Siphonobacter sp. BAB-5385]
MRILSLLVLLSCTAAAQPAVIQFTNAHRFDTSFRVDKRPAMQNSFVINWQDSTSFRFYEAKAGTRPQQMTLVPESQGAIFKHFTDPFSYTDFPVFRGDTLTLTYTPTGVLAKNQKGETYPDVFADDTSADGFSAWGMYLNYTPMIRKRITADYPNWTAIPSEKKEAIKRQYKQKLRRELYERVKTQMVLAERRNDSLQRNRQIPALLYTFNTHKIAQIRRIIDFEQGLVPDSTLQGWFRTYTAPIAGLHDYYYQTLLETVVESRIIPWAGYISSGGATLVDSRAVFDHLTTSPLFPARERDWLLTRQLATIREDFSRDMFLTYYTKLTKVAADSLLLTRVRGEYALEFDPARINTKGLLLQNASGKRTDLATLLAQQKGKVVYVDFWASWCAPCRASLPASRELRQALKDEPVTFLYLSMDESMGKWDKAAQQEDLKTYTHSYLALNPASSAFIQQQKIASIPRYMIFDKKGQLTYPNAPRVESKELGSLLKNLAAKP